MASSSSSNPHSRPPAFSGIEPPSKRRTVEESSRLFDVFINHRGPDVKHTVALQIYNSLTELGIRAFLDSEEKELGDSFPSTIENAIHSASAQIAIFSDGYAESPWCLAELVLMSQSRAKIFPLFYGVKPSDLRYIEKGVYAKAFTNYEKKERYMEKLKEWKEALQSVSFITGHEISSNSNDWQNVVSAVLKEVQRTKSLHVAKYPVGLHKLVTDFERLCLDKLVKDFERQCWTNEGSKEKPQIVGIYGMGGAGKTTLAKELFNLKKSQYRRSCFLFDVRTAYATNSFPSLQLKLLKDLFQQDELNFHCTEEGTSHIEDCIGRSNQLSFLIVVDDIDHVQQLDALLIMEMLKKSVKSLIIVTTRDVGVLINTGITAAYNLKGMDRDDARELFCWHAFGQTHPANDYQNLVNSFLSVCGGLPLSLQVLGSHVRGRDQNYWSLELSKVKKTLPRDIHQRLKISFDALDDEEQQIFMDIACFFVGELKEIAIQVWEASGWSAQHALETLENKCLVQEMVGFRLRMHDHLRDLGREMANALSRPRRLWRPQDLEYLKSEESQNILAQTKGRCFHSFLDKLTGYRITYFVGVSEFSAEWATILLWLQVEFPSRIRDDRLQPSIPSWIPLQNLRYLIIRNLRLKTLWQSHIQAPTQLKELQIYDTSLEEFSDLLGMSNSLEKIVINRCPRLKTLLGLSDLKKLVEWNISECPELEELPCIARQTCLEKLTIVRCGKLQNITLPTTLADLTIDGCRELKTVATICDHSECLELREFSSVARLSCLKHITISTCDKLQTIQGIDELRALESLQLKDCPEYEEQPCFPCQTCLVKTTIVRCGKVQNITLPTTLADLTIVDCRELKTVAAICDHSERLELQELSSVARLSYLNQITIRTCDKLQTIQGIDELRASESLQLIDCPELEELHCFARQTCLEKITIVECGKLQNITLPTTLVDLTINGCSELKTVATICDRSECLELQELSSVARLSCLKQITIRACDKLQSIQGIDKLHALKSMQLSYCSNAAIQNCITMLKSLPSELLIVMGRPADGVLSTLNSHLFSDANAVIHEVGTRTSDKKIMSKCSAVIFCAVVVVDSFTSFQRVRQWLWTDWQSNSGWVWAWGWGRGWDSRWVVWQGEWIITIVTRTTDEDKRIFNPEWERLLVSSGIIKKGYKVGLKKDEEWKSEHVLHTITDRLYHK